MQVYILIVENNSNGLSENRKEFIMSYKTNEFDETIYVGESGVFIAVRKLIVAFINVNIDDEIIFTQAKKMYGSYITDDELKEFIDEADRTLRKA